MRTGMGLRSWLSIWLGSSLFYLIYGQRVDSSFFKQIFMLHLYGMRAKIFAFHFYKSAQ